ncbi:MAG: hypothetical protein JXA90_12960 [Planctomycetes bacterium]|nr:hypothetical protein [Planctomycetota bacterium]
MCRLLWLSILLCFAMPGESAGSPRWVLVYARQYGEHMTGGVAGQAELFAHQEDGRAARIGMTNRYNLATAIFGTTDVYGNSRITFDINNRMYDFQVHDPGVATDVSPDCYWLDSLPHFGHYRFEFHWRRIADPDSFTASPLEPMYHYDLVDGFNQPPNREPAGFSTDAYELTDWADYQAQTFVVPMGQNRILAAKSFCVRQHAVRFTMRATIRRGGPTGAQVGPAAVSREVFSNEFPNVLMTWPLDGVAVTPGETYALRLDAVDGQGFNVYATRSNNYSQGDLYNGPVKVTGRDMIAVVVGGRVEEEPAILRGDCNQDRATDLSDAVSLLGCLYLGDTVRCLDACDADDTGRLELTDAVYVLSHLYLGGPALPAPSSACGRDPTPDTLSCESSLCP